MATTKAEAKANRSAAIERGDRTYEGRACKNCGTFAKRVNSCGCVRCSNEKGRATLDDANVMAKYRTKEKRQKWLDANKDRVNGIKEKYAKKPEAMRLRAERYEINRINRKSKSLQKLYNITIDEYEALRESQGGKCSICGISKPIMGRRGNKALAVDHCHTTGKVRGLLCVNCNTALGLFGEDMKTIKKAITYLEKN